MTPLAIYRNKLSRGQLTANSAQITVLERLEVIYHRVIRRSNVFFPILYFQWLSLRQKIRQSPSMLGLYLYGPVGSGKTVLLDIFYEALPVRKMRFHFHAFMQYVHNALRRIKGVRNPLTRVARNLKKKTVVLCLDEFLVSNVADAMILAGLLEALLHQGICLVITSNTAPDELYSQGLQRERFLPAIHLIQQHLSPFCLNIPIDYRRVDCSQGALYFLPLNDMSRQKMETLFKKVSYTASVDQRPIKICHRSIAVVNRSSDVVWFRFDQICGRPRSHRDYLKLVKKYSIFFVSDVPALDDSQVSFVVSFIHLVDVLYDVNKGLVLSAAVPVDYLYSGIKYRAGFNRTASRLIAMQSTAYFDKIHRLR